MHLLTFQATLVSLLVLCVPRACLGQSTVTIIEPASTSPPSPSYTDPAKFRDAILNSTNTYRLQHNATTLTWNTSLASIANNWSSKCAWSHSGGPTGENLAKGYANVTAAVDAWGDEQAGYNYKDPGFSESTGHFTQLVWRNTTTVGCAATDCNGKDDIDGFILVCEYWPAGNVVDMGQFQANVLPILKNAKGSGSGAPSGRERGLGWWAVAVTIAAVVVAGGLM